MRSVREAIVAKRGSRAWASSCGICSAALTWKLTAEHPASLDPKDFTPPRPRGLWAGPCPPPPPPASVRAPGVLANPAHDAVSGQVIRDRAGQDAPAS